MTNLEDALGEIDVLSAAEATDTTPTKSALDDKINEHFAGAVVRDLVKAVRGNAVVPSYVLEYLLGQYAASDDEATIQAGINSVRQILATHYVNRNEHMLVKSRSAAGSSPGDRQGHGHSQREERRPRSRVREPPGQRRHRR